MNARPSLFVSRIRRRLRGSEWAIDLRTYIQQAPVVRGRIAALAPILAALMLLWLPVDLATLSKGELVRLLPIRLAAAAALLLLGRHQARLPVGWAVALLLGLQAGGYGAMWLCLDVTSEFAHRGYRLAPFMLAAQLAIFPLSWRMTLRCSAFPLALLMLPWWAGTALPSASLVHELWLLTLLVLTAGWGGRAQLGLLTRLDIANRDAAHDALTGLANRRSADRALEAARARAARSGSPLSLLLIDLDHFKQVNDRWGHDAGDLVLRAVARTMADQLRGGDLACRWGGEEFLAILPDTDAAVAFAVAERLREGIGELLIDIPGDRVAVKASLGVATLESGESAAALVSRADEALYRAKSAGRNRCMPASPRLLE